MASLKRILISGGTHGNELTGVQLVRNWLRNSTPILRQTLDVQLLLANPEAIRLGRRYVDFDLNRAFAPDLLDIAHPTRFLDVQRAREINRIHGPKGTAAAPDLVIDLHNSTANMGVSLIINQPNSLLQRISAILAQEFPEVRLFYQPEPLDRLPYLCSIATSDLTIEAGPQAHSTLKASLLLQVQRVVLRLLDLLDIANQGQLDLTPCPSAVYTEIGQLDYPRDEEGLPSAMVHPKLEGRDFEPLVPGEPVFLAHSGADLFWTDSRTVWPCFIGEAAYQEKHIAMTLLHRSEEQW
ncbi:MAG TPA: aspartoacylase [Fibrobacteraceae bacterium]|nr:aspartoacylase [Fibrobacteraceae bacterium]